MLAEPSRAAALTSVACIVAYEGRDGIPSRSIARNLDYLAYAVEIRKRADGIAQALLREIGREQVGELVVTADPEE